MENSADIVTQNIKKEDTNSADLDEALAIAGLGRYNIKYSLVLTLLLIATIVELISYSLVIPAAVCDLQMTDKQRGLITSVPFIGIIITSYPWGYLVDTQGRKKMIVLSSLAAGIFGVLSGLMPYLTSFAICKLLISLCLACPSAVPYTFIGEILPARYRDITLTIINATQISGTAVVPALAWAILPLNFRITMGTLIFRPWRLLTIVYSLMFIIVAIMMSFGPESPKYLVSQGRFEEALKVLQDMYAGNKGKRPEEYPITKLVAPPYNREKGKFLASLRVQTLPLMRWTYFKWLLLNGFLLFGIFAILNGLYYWVPDVLNRVLTHGAVEKTACQVIYDRLNQTLVAEPVCNDTIDQVTLVTNLVSRVICALIAIIVSSTSKFIGKKHLLISCYWILGFFCILINFITNDMVFAVLLSSFPIIVLAMGPINAYTVELFPTHLRGMAVSLSMMFGRIGSIICTNVAGLLINNACEVMFYSFGSLLLWTLGEMFSLRINVTSGRERSRLWGALINPAKFKKNAYKLEE